MKSLKASIAFLTLMALVITQPYGLTYVEAQTGAPTTPGAAMVPNYAAASMQALLGNASNNVTSAMAACDVGGIAGDKTLQGGLTNLLTKSKSGKGGAGAETGGGDCSSAKSAKEFKCDMTCSEPTDFADGATCSDYYTDDGWDQTSTTNVTSKLHNFIFKDGSKEKYEQDNKAIKSYISFLQFKSSTCVSKTLTDVSAAYAKYQCKMNALSSAVSQASSALQQALTQNSQNHSKMLQFTKQVGDQMKQIDEILGPDSEDPNAKSGGGAQFQGLLGIQKSLNEQLGSWTANEATFKGSVDQIKKDTDTNDQTLEADRMGQVTDCMKGNTNLGVSGGRSLTCYKAVTQATKDSSGASVSTPVTDSSGNVKYSKQACGALEYVRSQVEQAPFRKGMNTNSRRDASVEYTNKFDSMVNSMMRDMGSYDAASADGKLVGRSTSWNDLAKKYSGDMQDLSALSGVNIAAQMNTVASSCYNSSYSWKNQQLRSAASPYNKKKNEIQSNTNKLNSQLTQGLSDMNGQYGAAMSILTNGKAVSIDRSSCTANDPAKLQACYSSIKDKMQGIMDGTGAVGTTTKSIAGGSMVPTFSVSCKGITGCVTTYQNIRKMKKAQATASQKATEDFVNTANAQVQNQLQSFAQGLAGLQSQVSAQFGNMQGLLAKLGIESSAKPNFMTPEQLEQQKSPEGGMGPFGQPKSMASVLSGMVQPTGLMNFQDPGASDILKAAQDKAKSDKQDLADKLKTYQSGSKKLAELATSCTKDNVAKKSTQEGGSVGSIDGSNCYSLQQQCDAAGVALPITGDEDSTFNDVLSGFESDPTSNQASNARLILRKLLKVKGPCSSTAISCLNTMNTNKTAAYTDAGNAGGGNNSNNAGGTKVITH
jgi:hypothetical protein